MKELQSPFSKASAYMSTPQSHETKTSNIAADTNKNMSKNDSANSKQTSDLNNKQQQNKAQDSKLDNSKMNLKDADETKAIKKDVQPKFSLTDYFKQKAQEKMMNQVSSSKQDNPSTPEQPKDNSPSATKPKKSPKPSQPNTNLMPPTPKTMSPKFAKVAVPKMKIPSLRPR